MGWAGAKDLGKMGGDLGTQQQSGSSVIVTDMQNGFSDRYNGSQYGGQNGGGQYGVDQYGGGQYASGNMTFDNTRFMKINWQTNGLFLQQVKQLKQCQCVYFSLSKHRKWKISS